MIGRKENQKLLTSKVVLFFFSLNTAFLKRLLLTGLILFECPICAFVCVCASQLSFPTSQAFPPVNRSKYIRGKKCGVVHGGSRSSTRHVQCGHCHFARRTFLLFSFLFWGFFTSCMLASLLRLSLHFSMVFSFSFNSDLASIFTWSI